MKVSLNWLQDIVSLREKDPEELARRLTASVGEVEEVEVQGVFLERCCVGKVLSVRKHPNADKLSLCEVLTDEGVKKVVCGGTNLREGMLVAFAHVGAKVRWHGMEMLKLQKTAIRGEESEGMICAAEELDLQERFPPTPEQGNHPIVDFTETGSKQGAPLKNALGLDDVIFHVDNHAITHRADLFSQIGFARELVALGLAQWKDQKTKKRTNEQTFPRAPLPFRFINGIPDLLPRYCACIVAIEGLGETPEWMRKRLLATGWRLVSLPIDITNYVAMEVGMPLHSFDAGDIRGDVRARLAREGETITTLDGVTRALPEGTIVLSDDEGIFDLLGVMGGLRSSTKETTRMIYLHSAAVDPSSIRRTIIATGHRTDAATVYEKGIPRVAVRQGLLRALELMLSLLPGARITSKMESFGNDGKAKPITFSLASAHSMLGVEVPQKRAKQILEALEFSAKIIGKRKKIKQPGNQAIKQLLQVTPPLHRLGDIKGPHDLVEEIGRIMGFDSIEPVMPEAGIQPPKRDRRIGILRDALKEEGFVEILPISLVGPGLLEQAGFDPNEAISIKNPLGEEASLLQTSTLPPLLEHAERNSLHAGKELKTFCWGTVFGKGRQEHLELGLLLADLRAEGGRVPEEVLLRDPFLLLKQHLAQALRGIGATAEIARLRESPPFAHPGRAASVAADGKQLGILTEVHPAVRARFGLLGRAAAACIDFSALLSLPGRPAIASPVPQFPAIIYDDTVSLTQRHKTGAILRQLRGAHELLESVEVADLYHDRQQKADAYNLTLRFTYRAHDCTLTEEEARNVHAGILERLRKHASTAV